MGDVVMIVPSYNFVKSIHKLLSEANNISYLKLLTDSLLVLDVTQEFSLTFADIHNLKVIFLDTFVEWTYQFASSLSPVLNENTGEIRIVRIVNNIVLETFAVIDAITNELKSGCPEVPKPLINFSNHLKFVMKTSSKRMFGWIDYCCKLRNYCSMMLHCTNFTNTSLDLNKADNKNLSSLVNIQQHLLKLSSVFITLDTLRRFSDEIPLEQLQTPVVLTDSKKLKHTPIISGNENTNMNCERKGRKLVDKCCFERFCGPSPSTSICTPVPKGKEKVRKYIIRLPKEEWKSHKTPWTIEESIALWHGVMHAPGSKSWSQIWHQSFRHSNRSQVNLKDRWRVIDNSETIKNAIRQAYVSWTSQFTNGKDSPVRYNHLPMPIIVRTCQST
ncbi:unnamed protein product [Schistosoma rodhaini]|uniref:Myb-like domain-containing protein n=1 Tax=Schistosoma rodhaini TaxID=6188 RepID=A0AA85GB80_9TREM|nr:unnamed protein product [Schistosoma rodhaini]